MQGDFEGAGHGGFEIRPHRHRHAQQHRALVAVVGERADRDFFGQWPGDVTGHQACGQSPVQLGGQARIARVLPIGVPVQLVRDLQAQPHRLARLHALRCVGDQFCPHLVGGDAAARLGRAGQAQRQQPGGQDKTGEQSQHVQQQARWAGQKQLALYTRPGLRAALH